MVAAVAEHFMLSSGYAMLYQKGKFYVHKAIFYLNKGQVSQDLKEGFLTYLVITPLLMLILYCYLHFFPFLYQFLFKLLQSTQSID